MLLAVALAVPLMLLGLALAMERVEQPLRHRSVGQTVDAFLETARPEEVEAYVREGLGPALDRFWRRRRLGRRLVGGVRRVVPVQERAAAASSRRVQRPPVAGERVVAAQDARASAAGA